MKNIKIKFVSCFSVIVLLFVSLTDTKAQSVELGMRLMPTISSFDVRSADSSTIRGNMTLGFGFGGLIGYNFTENAGIEGDVIFSSISQKYKEVDVEHKINLKYLNIPILLSLNTGKTKQINFNMVAGPQIGISVGSRLFQTGTGDTYEGQGVLSVKKGDLGFAYGTGLDFGMSPSGKSRLSIGFRGVYGLFDISDNSNTINTGSYFLLEKVHIKTYSVYIGLSVIL